MKIMRVKHNSHVFYGILEEDSIKCLEASYGYTESIPLAEVSMLPLVLPSKVVCVGLNFHAHAAELSRAVPEQPAFFLKPPSSIIQNDDKILLPENVGRIDYEGELAIVIGQACRNISPENVQKYIFGYTCANDVTARDLQKDEVLMGRCKSFDTFCPVGPWIETTAPSTSAKIQTLVNGEVRQEGSLEDMIFDPYELISSISHVMTLLPGDVVLTGTPSGVGAIKAGDIVQVHIEDIGILTNPVENDPIPDSYILQ